MEVAGTPNEAQESNMLIENIENDKTSTTERKKDEPDERSEKGEGESCHFSGQAGVEEGIWTELWSRSLPVRLTQQQPCHRPNPPNQLSTTGAETSKQWRRGCAETETTAEDGGGRKRNTVVWCKKLCVESQQEL